MRFEIVIALVVLPAIAHAQEGMSEYRERFRAGLSRYQAGAFADAIQYWEPIYRELGPERGWRLAFNLARAYEQTGDATRAVERYEAFLAQVAQRRQKGETIEALIDREEVESRAHVDELARNRGRIVLLAGNTPVAVKVDGSEPRIAGFTAYVAPGRHVVVFDPGSKRESRREIELKAGEAIELPAPEAPPEPTDVRPVSPPPPAPVVRFETHVERPFSSTWLFVAGGAAIASIVVPVLTYRSALDFQEANRLSSDPGSEGANARTRDDYDSKRSLAYATVAIPVTLAAATGVLSAYWFAGTRERRVPVVAVDGRGAYAGWRSQF